MLRLFLTAGSLALAGCIATVSASAPKPQIVLPAGRALTLRIAPEVPNDAPAYLLPDRRFRIANVYEWRNTLAAGFENGFHARRATGQTLLLQAAQLQFVPAGMRAQALIRFKASLLDASGAVIKTSEGVVTARTLATPGPNKIYMGVQGSTDTAVEAMYEAIASDLFDAPARQRACQPGTGIGATQGVPGSQIPGLPGTPGHWVPGTPGTPGFCTGGGPNMPMTCMPGTPGTPGYFVPGTPPTPGTSTPSIPGTPSENCIVARTEDFPAF
jgi:hypothetical protein